MTRKVYRPTSQRLSRALLFALTYAEEIVAMWCDDVVHGLEGPQTVNDLKTPSGRVHVGAL
jgi:hypothetical protein